MDTLALIQTSQNGSREAFNQLVLSYQDQVYTHAYYLLGERELAEDITQEVFIRAILSPTFCGSFCLAAALPVTPATIAAGARSCQLPAADLPIH
jgi:hypothetical protein